jgi:hypothetical protein
VQDVRPAFRQCSGHPESALFCVNLRQLFSGKQPQINAD